MKHVPTRVQDEVALRASRPVFKLGAVHRHIPAGPPEDRRSDRFPLPPGFRLLEPADDAPPSADATDERLAEGPGGVRVTLRAYRQPRSVEAPRGPHDHQAVRHPNILPALGIWQISGFLVVATEAVEHSLAGWSDECQVSAGRGIAPAELVEALGEAARAIDYVDREFPDNTDWGWLTGSSLRLVGGGVMVALPASWSRRGELLAIKPDGDRLSGQSALASLYLELRDGLPPVSGRERRTLERALAAGPDVRCCWDSCRNFTNALGASLVEDRPPARAFPFAAVAASGALAVVATLALAGRLPQKYGAPWAGRPVTAGQNSERRAVKEADRSAADQTIPMRIVRKLVTEAAPSNLISPAPGTAVTTTVRPAGPEPATPAETPTAPEPVAPQPTLTVLANDEVKATAGKSRHLSVELVGSGFGVHRSLVEVRLAGLPKGWNAAPTLVRLDAPGPHRADLILYSDEDAPGSESVVSVIGQAYAEEGLALTLGAKDLTLRTAPKPGLAARRSGDEALKHESFRAAADAYTLALSEAPDDVAALHGRGLAYYGMDDFDHALADLKRAEGLSPADAAVRNNLGLTLLAKGDTAAAARAFEAARQLDPTFAVVRYNLGRAFVQSGDTERAVAEYDEAIRLNSTFAKAFKARADAHSHLGRHARALADYDRALQLNPHDATTLNNRGLLRFALSEPQKAIADFDEAIRVNPRYAVVRYNRGRVYAQLGDSTEAITSFDQALAADPTFARAYKARADVLARRGDVRRAAADRNQATRLESKRALGHEKSQ